MEATNQEGLNSQPEGDTYEPIQQEQPEGVTPVASSTFIPNPGYFSFVNPFKEKPIKGGYVKIPGLSTSEVQLRAEEFSKLVKDNDLGDSRPEWLKDSVTKVFESAENFMSTPSGIHQDLPLDDLSNEVTYGGESLNARKPIYKKTPNTLTNAATFMAMARSTAGMGSITRFPLWNSGFWISLSVPREVDVLYTIEKIANEALLIGTDTGKFIGTMHDAVTYSHIIDFINAHYRDSNVKVPEGDSITNYILLSDVPSLISGMISTMYPDGYSVTRTCKNNYVLIEDGKTKCNHKVTGLINPSLMLVKNNKLITPEMIVHMSKRTTMVSIEEVKEYQIRLNVANATKVIKVTDTTFDVDYEVTLYIPSITAYAQCLAIWKSDIENELDRFLEVGDSMEDKREKAFKLLNSSYLSHFLSYAKSIKQINNIDGVDLNTIDLPEDTLYHSNKAMLEMMSSITPILSIFEKEVRDYIHVSTNTIVGLPNYICPTCNELQVEKSGRDFDNIIPIDMIKLFFILSQMRVS